MKIVQFPGLLARQTKPRSQTGPSGIIQTEIINSPVSSSQDGTGLSVVLAVGPGTVAREHSPMTRNDLKRLILTIQEKLPAAQFVSPKFTINNIAAVTKSLALSDRILYIFMAHGINENGEFQVNTDDGWVTDRELSDAIRQKNTEVILFACHAGAFSLQTIPDVPVFGASPAEEPGSAGYAMAFIDEINASKRPFPTTAQSMYDAWNDTPGIKPQKGPCRAWWGFHSKSGEEVVGMKNIPPGNNLGGFPSAHMSSGTPMLDSSFEQGWLFSFLSFLAKLSTRFGKVPPSSTPK